MSSRALVDLATEGRPTALWLAFKKTATFEWKAPSESETSGCGGCSRARWRLRRRWRSAARWAAGEFEGKRDEGSEGATAKSSRRMRRKRRREKYRWNVFFLGFFSEYLMIIFFFQFLASNIFLL
jgi:hypothetical protein